MFMFTCKSAAALCAFALSSSCLGQVHESDVILSVANGRIVTGRVENSIEVFPRFVFSATLGDGGIPSATFNPGYEAESGTFSVSELVGLTIRRALRKWDGTSFSTIPPEQLQVIRTATISTPAQDPTNCGVSDSVALGVANPLGGIHIHPAYQLGSPASAGIYLLELQAWMTDSTTGVSLPFWVVFNQNDSPSNLQGAFEWAEVHLAGQATCFANCDGSTSPPILNVNDFTCFLQRFAAADCAANCDGSTSTPVLNVNDFNCFLSRFAAGCP
jgi:hypothetical protein